MATFTEKLLDAAEAFQAATKAYHEAQHQREAAAAALESAEHEVIRTRDEFNAAHRALSNAAVGKA